MSTLDNNPCFDSPVGSCFTCATNTDLSFLVTDTTVTPQALAGSITIPANKLAPGVSFFTQIVSVVKTLGSTASKLGFLHLALDGNLVAPLSFQSINMVNLTTVHSLMNAGIGGFVSAEQSPNPNFYVFSVALGDIKSGGSIGFAGNARWEVRKFSPGGFGVGDGGWLNMLLDTTIPHTLQWFFNWNTADNSGVVLQGLLHKVWYQQ